MSNTRKGTISVKKDLLRPGVSIKQEPGVEIQIKQEPGTGILKPTPDAAAPGRLSSFKLPRDLTLGGQNARKAPKKVYTPNLNAVRVKKDSPTAQEPVGRGTGRGRGRGRGQNERGRGRGRQNTNLVQSAGIFSEGSADILRRGGSSSGSYAKDDSTNILQKPTLNLKQELKVDITEEGEHLKALLGELDNPIKSPYIETNPIVLSASKHDVISKGKLALEVPLKKIKQEPGIVVKTEIEDNNDGLVPELSVKNLDENAQEQSRVYNRILSLPGLFSMQNSPFFLLQLPDTLPGQGAEEQIEKQPEASKEESSKSTTKIPAKCTLKDLDSGFIGKMVLYKSGKSKLVLGQTCFDLELGSQTCFLQDVISIDVNTTQRSGSMINLGQVQSKVIASPDWNLLTSKQS